MPGDARFGGGKGLSSLQIGIQIHSATNLPGMAECLSAAASARDWRRQRLAKSRVLHQPILPPACRRPRVGGRGSCRARNPARQEPRPPKSGPCPAQQNRPADPDPGRPPLPSPRQSPRAVLRKWKNSDLAEPARPRPGSCAAPLFFQPWRNLKEYPGKAGKSPAARPSGFRPLTATLPSSRPPPARARQGRGHLGRLFFL
jgi:hypothetical protein